MASAHPHTRHGLVTLVLDTAGRECTARDHALSEAAHSSILLLEYICSLLVSQKRDHFVVELRVRHAHRGMECDLLIGTLRLCLRRG